VRAAFLNYFISFKHPLYCTGLLAAASQLITNSPYSHIGIALRLPNKWTQEEELYIVELTKNYNRYCCLHLAMMDHRVSSELECSGAPTHFTSLVDSKMRLKRRPSRESTSLGSRRGSITITATRPSGGFL
jgi:hypothetical protein